MILFGADFDFFHQSGTSKMPQRRWLGIGASLIPRMEKEIAQQAMLETTKGKTTQTNKRPSER